MPSLGVALRDEEHIVWSIRHRVHSTNVLLK